MMSSSQESYQTRAVPRTWSPLTNLAGKRVLLLGTTGFLAKVMLSMLLERFGPERIYCSIRGTRSKTPRDRLFDEVLSSDMMEPLRKRFGSAFEAIVDKQIEPIEGDLNKPNLGLSEETLDKLKGQVDVIINSAGLVNFNPQLEQAIVANTIGALTVAELARDLGAKLVHVSTCYVAGATSGRVREDDDILGSFPRQDKMPDAKFEWKRELSDVLRIIEQVKARTDDAALESTFRMEALKRLKAEGREPHERTLRAAIANQRRRWVAEEQIRQGLERAKHWGWTNIYTYSKALGEQAVASTEGLDWAIVRPAIVESALEYPFPGWNEGMNTTAPLAYLGLNGQVTFPADNKLILDIVPVDFVASTTVAAAAALIGGESQKVYQVAAGDVNPCTMARTVTLVGVYRRRKTKAKIESGEIQRWKGEFELRQEPHAIPRTQFEYLSTPALVNIMGRARSALDTLEPERYGFLSSVVTRAQKKAQEVEEDLIKVRDAFELFMPFIWENRYIFITKNTRNLFNSMTEADRMLLPFETETLDWRNYWLDVHLPGLEKWVFPKLDIDGPKRVSIPRDYKDLAELFDTRTREHSRHVAYRVVRKNDLAEAFTFRDVRKASFAASKYLENLGVKEGDKILLISEGRPEWGMSYFGVVLSGAVTVPIDVDLSVEEVANIARSSNAQWAICSPKYEEQLTDLFSGKISKSSNGKSKATIQAISFDDLFSEAHIFDDSIDLKPKKRRPEDPASIIFTSGTTGQPKGVVLTHQNFAALTARMSSLFDLGRGDALLSVLPPHHTFEFSAGLLMPMSRGSSVTYLEERTPELVSRAFDETPVTAMIGVPAVIESLHRRIQSEIERLPLPLRLAVRQLIKLNELLRERSSINLGYLLFRAVHLQFGGRLRYLVSGAAPLRHDVFRDLHGLGFGVHEGYGLTEAAPVLTVGWPRHHTPVGSVGWPLPGLEVRILDPDQNGVGEVIARGPTIMKGYLDAPEATQETIRAGWLHTGDRGRMDDEGRLYIVGREKDTIIDSSGKNVYPDEIEEIYNNHPMIDELSVVGIPAEHGPGERVACLVVPNYTPDGASPAPTRAEVHQELKKHFHNTGNRLPLPRRVKVIHFWDGALPRTSTRKVRRTEVRKELMRLEETRQTLHAGINQTQSGSGQRGGVEMWVLRTLSAVTRRPVEEIKSHSRLVDDLGADSLMQLELHSTLESELPKANISPEELTEAATVGELIALAQRDQNHRAKVDTISNEEHSSEPRILPAPLTSLGKMAVHAANRWAYSSLFDISIHGEGNIPANRNFLVASNHSSHLDMGLVKTGLGVFGEGMKTVAAKDYFFDDPIRGLYFKNFTDLIPMDRHGSLRKSLKLASEAIRGGDTLLIFPEGTRSRDGVMTRFKTSIGWLCLHERVDVLPIWLGGAHEALPVGARVPKAGKLEVRIGEPVRYDLMVKATHSMSRSQAYRYVTEEIERRVRALGGLPPLVDTTQKPATAPKSQEEEQSQP